MRQKRDLAGQLIVQEINDLLRPPSRRRKVLIQSLVSEKIRKGLDDLAKTDGRSRANYLANLVTAHVINKQVSHDAK